MGTYIARRLLLMIPTLLGITFLVFMLVALSPGGIGASLGDEAGRGGQAMAQAYFEDRYGLDDPVLVQYGRWLARISPIKFGPRDQVDPDGEVVRMPRGIREPAVWTWFSPQLPWAVMSTPDATDAARKYHNGVGEYADRRAAYVAADVRLRQELAEYVRAARIVGALTADGRIRADVLVRHAPDRSRMGWADLDRRGREAIQAYAAAITARADLVHAIEAHPFPAAGAALIPGVVSIAMPDLGRSIHSQSVLRLICAALPVTLLLNLMAFPIIYAVAVPGGMLAAVRPRSWLGVGSGVLFVALWSVPIVWAGTMAIGFLASRQYLGWFPVSGLHSSNADELPFLPGLNSAGRFAPGWLLDTLWHVALPVACLVYTGFAVLAKQTRATMLDNMGADYVRTARAKGVPERDIVLRHVLRNSLLPLITIFVQIFPATLAGSVVIERIFSIPGMGSLLLTAIQERDREVILANTIMIAGVNLLALLLADVLYAMADPRVSYE